MYNGRILINGIESARSFVALTAEYPKLRITLNCNEYSVDAHSIIGILSLDLSQPLNIRVEGDETEKFVEALAPFTV